MIGLEYVLEKKDITKKEVANAIGCYPQQINDWIRGRRKIPEKRLKELEQKLNVPSTMLHKTIDDKDKVKLLSLIKKDANIYELVDEVDFNIVNDLYEWKDVIDKFKDNNINVKQALKIIETFLEIKKI